MHKTTQPERKLVQIALQPLATVILQLILLALFCWFYFQVSNAFYCWFYTHSTAMWTKTYWQFSEQLWGGHNNCISKLR